MERIVTLTMNPAIDMSTRIDHVVADRKLRCAAPRYEPGGGGINVSRALRRLETGSEAVFPAGGETGDLLRRLLAEEGVDAFDVPVEAPTRMNVIVSEAASGRQFRFGMPGARLEEDDWRRCLDTVTRLDPGSAYVAASGSLPPGVPEDFYAALARTVKEAGGRMVLDTSGPALAAAVGEGVYLVKPNMRELRSISGADIVDDTDLEEAARAIVSSGGARIVVVSRGAAGVVLATEEGVEWFRAPTVPVESRVGAGDSMVAGIVSSLALGNRLEEAVRYGVAAGAAAVMTPGSELCRAEDVLSLYERMLLRAEAGTPPAPEL